ncbi:hypothetical protein Plhal304r1_c034g0106101 [Plasmopara halstedii]
MPLDSIATENYFHALQPIDLSLEQKDVAADNKHNVHRQIVRANVKPPETVKTSTENAFFVEKHQNQEGIEGIFSQGSDRVDTRRRKLSASQYSP